MSPAVVFAFSRQQNREMHDHMEYFLEGQDPPPLSNNNKPEIVYRWAPTHTHTVTSFLGCIDDPNAPSGPPYKSFVPPSLSSKPLTPTTQSNKALPFIKVIEIKSWEEHQRSAQK